MNNTISIRPSKDLRTNYAGLSELSKKNPVAITVNGREDTVLIGHDEYMRQQQEMIDLQARLQMYQHLADARDDIKLGRTQNANEVFDELKSEISNIQL